MLLDGFEGPDDSATSSRAASMPPQITEFPVVPRHFLPEVAHQHASGANSQPWRSGEVRCADCQRIVARHASFCWRFDLAIYEGALSTDLKRGHQFHDAALRQEY